MATDLQAKLESLVLKVRSKWEELGEELDNLEAALGGQATTGDQVKAFLATWCELWQKRYGTRYVVAGVKDAAGVKRVIKAVELEELRARARRYLRSGDRFYSEARHPLALFLSNVNKFAADAPGELFDEGDVLDCRHDPRCRTDAEHTRRKMQEARTR